MSERPTHPRADEKTKDRLWFHLREDHGGLIGHAHHYTKPVLVEIHRDLHAKKP